MDAKGVAAIVSGGASGLGEATVRRLHGAGAVVTVIDFNTDKGEALAKELGVKFVQCDVTAAEQVAVAVAASAEDASSASVASTRASMIPGSTVPFLELTAPAVAPN